jgi:hypothetical protein
MRGTNVPPTRLTNVSIYRHVFNPFKRVKLTESVPNKRNPLSVTPRPSCQACRRYTAHRPVPMQDPQPYVYCCKVVSVCELPWKCHFRAHLPPQVALQSGCRAAQ